MSAMNHYFTKNIEALNHRFPSVADEIQSATLPLSRRAVPSKATLPSYQVFHEGNWVSLTSLYDPLREAEQQLKGINLENVNDVFVCGEAGLYHLEVVLSRVSAEARVFLVAQSVEHLRLIFETRDLRPVIADERLYWLISAESVALRNAFQKVASVDAYRVPSFEVILHPVEFRVHRQFYGDVQQALESAYRTALMNYHTNGTFEQWWTMNFVSNLPFLLFGHHLSELKNSWSQKPVIVVGAGPSLDKNIHLLNQVRNRAIVICVGTAYRILEKHGIIPDMIVSIDGGPTNASHFIQCNYDGIPLLMDVYCHKDIVLAHRGPKVSFSSADTHQHWWDLLTDGAPMEAFNTGGSAATAAFNFARYIDADPVIMVGEDLSYPQGHRYARGAAYESDTVEDLKQTRHKLYEVEDIHGNAVYTTIDYLFYLKYFEQEASLRDRIYINATEGGALRRGFMIQTLADCLGTHCRKEFPVDEWKQIFADTPMVDAVMLSNIVRNVNRSRLELKAVGQFLSVVIRRAQYTLTAVRDESRYTELQLLSLLTEKMLLKLKRLPYALAFLDACSFSAVASDIRLADAIESENEADEQRQAILRIMQTIRLFEILRQKAAEAIESHCVCLSSLDVYRSMRGDAL